MEITVLMENAPRPGSKAEHGLSLLLETMGRTILFDFGQSGAFARNASLMGVDLSRVDLAVLSHGHYDHGGGIREFLRHNSHAPVYLSRYCFRDYRHGEKYIGLDPSLRQERRLRTVERDTVLLPGLTLLCCQDRPRAVPPQQDGLLAQGRADDFRHELCLEIREWNRKILVSGCSHNGIENLLAWFSPDLFLGGLHTRSMDVQGPEFHRLAQAMEQSQARFLNGRCTGKEQYDALKARLGEKIAYLYTGERFWA